MSFPCSFDESNHVLSAPPGIEGDCEPLSVMVSQNDEGGQAFVSCWKLTAEELAEVNRTGRVWVIVWGALHPPIAVCGEKPIVSPPVG
jgi:hypothetical protein